MRFSGPIKDLADVYKYQIELIRAEEAFDVWALNAATGRKNSIVDGSGYLFHKNIHEFAGIASEEIRANPNNMNHTRVLAYKTDTVKVLNREMRKMIYGNNTQQFEDNEIVICNGGYSWQNKPTLYNGEVLRVVDHEEVEKHPFGMDTVRLMFKDKEHDKMPTVFTLKNTTAAMNKYQATKDKLYNNARINGGAHWQIYENFLSSVGFFDYGYAQTAHKA